MGATTVWERWDAIRPDGSIHPGTMTTPPEMAERTEGDPHMLSFNHYAYGAVIDWVYRHVAGIAPDPARPGYRHVIMAPRPAATLRHAAAAIDGPLGRVSIAWRIDEAGVFRADIALPFGASATFDAPVTAASVVEVQGTAATAVVTLGPGQHVVSVTRPRLANAPPRRSSIRGPARSGPARRPRATSRAAARRPSPGAGALRAAPGRARRDCERGRPAG